MFLNLAILKMIKDQKAAIENAKNVLKENKQIISIIHGGAGVGKYFIIVEL